jgi:hypothetical protein
MAIKPKPTVSDYLIVLGVFVIPAVWLSAVGTMLYVAYHFIQKYW